MVVIKEGHFKCILLEHAALQYPCNTVAYVFCKQTCYLDSAGNNTHCRNLIFAFFMLMWMLLDVKIPAFNLILLNSILFYSVPIYPHVPFVFLQATFETVCISDPNFRWQFDCSQFCLFIYLITFHQSVEKMGLLIKNHDDFQRYDQAIWESFCPEGMADVKLRSECRLCRFISHNHQN